MIRITHPPHPLFGQTLEVINPRREKEETLWIVRLSDGSRTQLPSAWTNHPFGSVPTDRCRSGGRATPNALRQLSDLIANLVQRATSVDARLNHSLEGGVNERATTFVRPGRTAMDRPDLATDSQGETKTDNNDPGRDGPQHCDASHPSGKGKKK